MSKSYLRTIVRAGSRPINPSRGNRGRHAQANIEPVAETTVHAFFPPGETQHRLPPADRRQDPLDIHDDSAPAAEESAAQLGAAGEAVTPADLRSLMPQDSAVVTKALSVSSPLAPTAQDATRSSLPAVPDNVFPDLRGTASHPEQQANQNASRAGNALARSTAPEPIADAMSVILQAPGRADSAEGQDRHDQEIPAVVVPPTPRQPLGTGLQEMVQKGPAQPAASAQSGSDSPGSAIPPHSTVSDSRSSLLEGATRSLQPQKTVRDAHTDLKVFYVTPRESTPETATGPGAHTSDADKGPFPPAGSFRSVQPHKAAQDPRADLKVFYATPRPAAPEAAAMPKTSLAETDSGNTARPALLQPALSSVEGPAAQIVRPKAGADSAAQTMAPVVESGRGTAGAGERESIPAKASATKPHSALPKPVPGATPEPPSRESEPLAVRPREQAQMPPAAAPSRRDETGPRLLIHRLDVQIVTQKQPEPPRQIPQPQPAAAPRDAWEGVDRHYLHRVSVSA